MHRVRLLVFLLGLFLAACSEGREAPVITIGHAPHDHHAALFVAASRPDFFRDNGGIYLKQRVHSSQYELYDHERLLAYLNFTSSTGGAQLIRKLTERQFDMVLGGVPAMIRQIDAGSPLCMLMPLMTGGAGLIVREDFGVRDWPGFVTYISQSEKTVRIGYKTADSVQNLIFEQALEFEHIPFARGVDSTDKPVALVNMYGAKNLIPGMRNGVIDGFVVMEPYLTLAEKELGARKICSLDQLPPEGQWSDYPCCALAAVDRTFVRDNETAVVALLRLFRTAHAYIGAHPEDAAKVVADWLGQPEEVERVSLPSIHFLQGFTPSWRAGVRAWIASLVASGKLTGRVAGAKSSGELEKLLYAKEPLEKAKKVSR